MRNHFTFMRSYFEAIEDLSDADQLKVYRAISAFSLNDEEVELDGLANTIFKLIKPILIKGNNKSKNSSETNRKQNINKIETKQEHTPLEERKGKDKEEDINKPFSFSLSKKMQLQNTSVEYREKLQEHIKQQGKAMSYKDFYEQCEMNGYTYKNFKLAYDKWNKDIKPSNNTVQAAGWKEMGGYLVK